ncbi:hypothetical protein [Pontibacter rugosus]|uniref:TonB family protein n=1 Tax=Pontibacter rugosus TaxID=1745966 RepID=A0ABW3SPB7_9BACT
MKTKLYLLLFLFFSATASFAQISLSDLDHLHNTATFADAPEELPRLLGRNFKYPLTAMKAGKVGAVLGVIKISNEGKIIGTGTLNNADADFKKEFDRVARLTEHQWIPTHDSAAGFYAVIPMEFRVEHRLYKAELSHSPSYFRKPILIKVHTTPALPLDPISKHEEELSVRANEAVQKEKYEEAILLLEQLINLQPLHVPYYQNLAKLHVKVGNKYEAAYFNKLAQLLAG